jgi:hypothetical protein
MPSFSGNSLSPDSGNNIISNVVALHSHVGGSHNCKVLEEANPGFPLSLTRFPDQNSSWSNTSSTFRKDGVGVNGTTGGVVDGNGVSTLFPRRQDTSTKNKRKYKNEYLCFILFMTSLSPNS